MNQHMTTLQKMVAGILQPLVVGTLRRLALKRVISNLNGVSADVIQKEILRKIHEVGALLVGESGRTTGLQDQLMTPIEVDILQQQGKRWIFSLQMNKRYFQMLILLC